MLYRNGKRLLLIALSLLIAQHFAIADDWIPEGFEDLTKPQETIIDVFYGGIYLASVQARFEPGTITILDSRQVIARLPDLLDPEEFSTLIEFPLDTNVQLRCKSKASRDCGRLETKTLGVIFDQGKLKLDLFIGSALLRVRSVEQLKYLPNSDAGLSAIDDLALYASGATDADLTYNMSNNTLFGFRENRLKIDSNFTSEDDFTIDTLALQREKNGLDYQAGIFRANAGSFLFMQDQQFLGATFGTSLTTRLDLESALGTTFTVFLNSRSLVQIYKDDRLLGSSYYDTGNQEINVASLPAGAYDVELRITDSSGATRTERRFYSKNAKIPPEGESLFFVQAGQYVETVPEEILPETTDDSFVRAGYSRRIFGSLAASVGFSTNRESTMLETGFFHQGAKHELSASFAYDQYQRVAADIRLRYRYPLGNLNIGVREISGGDLLDSETSQIGQEARQANVSATFALENYGNFGFFGDYTQSQTSDEDSTQNYGLRWSPPVTQLPDEWSTNVELSRNDGEMLFLVRLKYALNNGAWSTSASADYKAEEITGAETEESVTGSVNTQWTNSTVAGNDYSASLRADHQQEDSITSSFDAKTNLGIAGLTAKHNIDADTWEYTGSVRTKFAANTSAIKVGGKSSGNSGFLVKVDGPQASDNLIEVKLNGSTKAKILANSEVFIPAGAYRTYELSFSPFGNSLESVVYRGRPMTLYPGNIISVKAELTKVIIVIGRVFVGPGEPLQSALIKGIEGLATTDANGIFQAEIQTDVSELVFVKGNSACTVQLPQYQARRNVARLGNLTCELQ